ncbi:DUF222 domain-containing protein [Actinoplanes sp. NPDC026619]|uniref:HNH endonuclease signature motif containing protein n=1 Tax=Actinoplanes sp. NPDC026619 TaxID=3155798 RepID=UPI0034049AB6
MLADLQQIGEATAKLAAAPLWPLSDHDLLETLRAADRAQQAAAALRARLVQQAGARGLPAAQGYRSTARWLSDLLLIDPSPAREIAGHASALGRRPAVEQAVLDGRLDLRQAEVIVTAVEAIPADLSEFTELSSADPTQLAEQAETVLIGMAARLPAHHLRQAGARILAHVAPEVADRAEEAALNRQQARAHQRRGFTLSLPADGTVRLSGLLDIEDAATVQAALHPLCGPATDDDRSPAQRRADALLEVCRLALRTGELPEDGGEPVQLSVTVAYHPLTHALGAAATDTGQRLPATTVRRLACDARILPLVLGGAGQILDAGRSRRLATGPLRRALHVRDGGCAFPDCDRPPRWTDAHHIIAWTAGGPTTLDNLVLLCRRHHRLIHHPTAGWQIRLNSDGLPEFLPPPAIDPLQHPRRNLYHPRQ